MLFLIYILSVRDSHSVSNRTSFEFLKASRFLELNHKLMNKHDSGNMKSFLKLFSLFPLFRSLSFLSKTKTVINNKQYWRIYFRKHKRFRYSPWKYAYFKGLSKTERIRQLRAHKKKLIFGFCPPKPTKRQMKS